MKKTILTLIILFLITACAHMPAHYTCNATQKKYANILDTWIHVDINKIVDSWGYPSGSFIAPNGNKVYVYEKSEQTHTPIIISSFGSAFAWGNASLYNNWLQASTSGVGASTMVISGGETLAYSCKTFFEVSSEGTVLKWKLEGNSCKSCTPEENLYLRCDKLFPPTRGSYEHPYVDSTFNSKLKKCVKFAGNASLQEEAIFTEDDTEEPIGKIQFHSFKKDECFIKDRICKNKNDWRSFVKEIMEEE